MGVEFEVLGDIQVKVDGESLAMGHARQLCVLAALVHDIGAAVSVGQLLSRVWGEDRPKGGRKVLYSYLTRLRQNLGAAEGITIVRAHGSYVLTGDEEMVDLHRFRRLLADARAADDEQAAELFSRAFALWRGKPFGALSTAWIDDLRTQLEAERFAAALDRNDVELRLGHHRDLLPEMLAESAAHALDERLTGQVMIALHRCGRSADADRHYRRILRRLAEELGVDPSPRLRELHERGPNEGIAEPGAPGADAAPVPRQLPAHTLHFVGRERELAALDNALRFRRSRPGQAVVVAISGPAGVGKTTLALHWAQRVQGAFPDGQLYVNLRGFDHLGTAVPSSDALRGFLFALGVAPHRMSTDLDTQTAMYRDLLGARRMLIVLDNARDAGQVQPLLPGTGKSAVLVTSRTRLFGLVAGEGAHVVTVRPLAGHDARELLSRHLGRDRVDAEPEVVDELIARSGALPLALAVLAARAALNPGFPLRALADELTDGHVGLDAFDGTDPETNVRAAISWSYQQLRPAAARMFRLLSAHPGPDFTTRAAASLSGTDLATAGDALDELVGVHLVDQRLPGRFALHDLVRAYAAEQAHAVDDETARTEALRRLLDHYLHTAWRAALILRPMRDPITLEERAAGATPEVLGGYAEAWRWFEAEIAVLIAVMHRAVDAGSDEQVWRLAWTTADYLDRKGRWHDWTEVGHVALAAGRRLRDQRALASAHRGLGHALLLLHSFEESWSHLNAALRLETDLVARAGVLRGLALLSDTRGHIREALEYGEQALALSRSCDDRAGEAAALNQVGWYHCRLGHHQRALRLCELALGRHRELGDWTAEAVTWDSLGYVHHHMGHTSQSVQCYVHALDLYRKLGDQFEEAATLGRLADVYEAEEDSAAASSALRRAVGILEGLHHPDGAGMRARLRVLADVGRT
jgi:DNA-binding SARP family transcriptional activator/Tfp pilus assembly protein PilF